MSIIFHDGFDHYTTVLDKWDNLALIGTGTKSVSIAPGVGRGGAGALACTYNCLVPSFNVGTANACAQKYLGAHTTMYVGFAFNWNPSGQVGDVCIAQFVDGSVVQCSLFISPAGTMYFVKANTSFPQGGTKLGTATTPYPSNSYHYIEVKVVISSTGGVLELRVDQTAVGGMTLSGLNNQVTTQSSFDTFMLGCGSGLTTGSATMIVSTCYFDDVYLDTAGYNGDIRVNGLLPTGNGSTQNFSNVEASWAANTVTNLQTTIFDGTNLQRATAITGDFKTGAGPGAPTWNVTLGGTTTDNHVTWTNLGSVSQYKLVNETDPDGDSSYIQSNTLNDISRFTYPAISGTSVLAVTVWVNGRKDDGGFRTIQGSIKSGSTTGTTGTDVSPGTNYAYAMLQSLTDPNTGAAWTLSAVNAAEFGIKITN